MKTDYTPTTDQIRVAWCSLHPRQYHHFENWLKDARARVWDEAVDHLEATLGADVKRAAHADNPYREAT